MKLNKKFWIVLLMKPTLLFNTLLLLPVLATASPITNFDTPPVIDLSGQLQTLRHSSHDIPIQPLDASKVAQILRNADGKLTLNPPFDAPVESPLATKNAQRSGKMLTVNTLAGSLQFKSWRVFKGDGDSSIFVYRGLLAGGALQRVDMYMGQDAPGSMLINNRNGKVYFVHSGDHPVAVSPDGSAVLEIETGNWRLQLATLTPPRRGAELFCSATADSVIDTDIHAWNQTSANGFDLVLNAGKQKVAVRLSRIAGAWRMESSQPALLAKLGVRCSVPN